MRAPSITRQKMISELEALAEYIGRTSIVTTQEEDDIAVSAANTLRNFIRENMDDDDFPRDEPRGR